MVQPIPLLAVRGSDGTSLLSGPTCEPLANFNRDARPSRYVTFSRDGSLFGWCNGHSVSVVRCADGSLLSTFDLPKTSVLKISPQNTVLATWQPYSSV
ncbi:eukaryotic translation initiation factor 2A [Notothenia coriiceps]|uniref:Eukaryotic translation initiation factor 2A n=1 Tax=Notothenia coriiceps TaxID=8208 RepID=A0A6I9MTC8_9TELE|nr:PREDICTED: eukaryotic translation initiation factor 2A [Notothenia coriiceps]